MKEPVVTVYTNDNNLWLLNGFQYLFRKYWSDSMPVKVFGYAPPKVGALADNFTFFSIDRRNYPASEWSNGVIRSLEKMESAGEEFIIFMLEDYWLNSPVNHDVIHELCMFMNNSPRNILRIDLTADRCQHRNFIASKIDLFSCQLLRTQANSPYQMSFQTGIWNIKLMQEILQPYEDPWASEIQGSKRLAIAGDRYQVWGTNVYPVRYQPVYRTKRVSIDISKLVKEDQDLIMRRGWI
jgi:hypothetical protein